MGTRKGPSRTRPRTGDSIGNGEPIPEPDEEEREVEVLEEEAHEVEPGEEPVKGEVADVDTAPRPVLVAVA